MKNLLVTCYLFLILCLWSLISGCLLPPPLPEDIREEVQANYRKYEEKISQFKDGKVSLLKELSELHKKVSQLQKELSETQQALIEVKVRHKELERILEKISFQKIILPLTPTTPSIILPATTTSTPVTPPERIINGKISGINRKANLVILSLGREHEIRIGLTGNVYRDDKIIGGIAVDLVEQDWSSSHIVREDKEFRVGDEVIFEFE